MSVQRFKPVIATIQYLGRRDQEDKAEMQTAADGGFVAYSDFAGRQTLLTELIPFVDKVTHAITNEDLHRAQEALVEHWANARVKALG